MQFKIVLLRSEMSASVAAEAVMNRTSSFLC